MCFGAHPDDIEVGCVGTILKHKAAGDNVQLVATTWGRYGNRSERTIRNEMKAAERILGSRYTVLDNKVGHYAMNWKTVTELDKLIADLNIDTVYCNWYGDSHQDHQATCRNVVAACRTRKVKNLYLYELASATSAFYEQVRILDDEIEPRRAARLTLIATVARTLKSGLKLLGIETLERI